MTGIKAKCGFKAPKDFKPENLEMDYKAKNAAAQEEINLLAAKPIREKRANRIARDWVRLALYTNADMEISVLGDMAPVSVSGDGVQAKNEIEALINKAAEANPELGSLKVSCLLVMKVAN